VSDEQCTRHKTDRVKLCLCDVKVKLDVLLRGKFDLGGGVDGA